jgi:hypothetical protein
VFGHDAFVIMSQAAAGARRLDDRGIERLRGSR